MEICKLKTRQNLLKNRIKDSQILSDFEALKTKKQELESQYKTTEEDLTQLIQTLTKKQQTLHQLDSESALTAEKRTKIDQKKNAVEVSLFHCGSITVFCTLDVDVESTDDSEDCQLKTGGNQDAEI